MAKKESAEATVRHIRRKTRKKYGAEALRTYSKNDCPSKLLVSALAQ